MQTLCRECGAGVPEGAEQRSCTGASCATAASARAGIPTAGLLALQQLKYLLLKEKSNYTLITLTQDIKQIVIKVR